MVTPFYPNRIVHNHHGIDITQEWDDEGESISCYFDREVCEFNSVDDARDWIDEQLDIPPDDNEEHRLRCWEVL